MATYTDNYSLTKPTFAEVADIRTINSNMDTIDDIMHASQVSLADAYDQTATYNTGDVVMYEFLMYKCKEDNVTGNWDATKWERTTAAETGGGEVDFDLFGEASGNPASFADGSASALVECETEIVPVQDLHGYSKPWAGGAGKNKWNEDYTGISQNITYKAINVGDGDFTCSSTCPISGNACNVFFLSGNVSSGAASATNGVSYGTPRTVTSSGGYVTIAYRNDFGLNPEDYNTMIESGTTPTTYEPYENICPISGHSSVTINVSPTSDTSQGVNTTIQLGDTYYGGTLNVGNGELVIDRELITLDGSNDEGWFKSGLTACDIFCHNDSTYTFNNDEVILNEFSFANQSNYNQIGYAWWDSAGAQLRIGFSTYNTTDLTAFKTWLGNNPIQITGFLATPITVQIPPTTINTLLGQNYVSSEDTEDIDVVYTKSTAPIKPNPSGTPSGELRSIELGGEKFEIIKELPTFPTSDGDYKLKLSVSSGVPTLSWVSDT